MTLETTIAAASSDPSRRSRVGAVAEACGMAAIIGRFAAAQATFVTA
jgi:hypothetical protein